MRRAAATVVLLLWVGIALPAGAQEATPTPTPNPASPPQIGAAAAILVDIEENRILYEKNARERRAPASLTKVVTALVARDHYELDEVVTATDRAASTTGSRLGLETGVTVTVKDLLYALLLRSGNDAATALADHHPLGYDHFISLMDEKARALGAHDSDFANPHGLDEEGHISSAWDMAIFARRLMADPLLAEIVSTERHTIIWSDGSERIVVNHNKLLDRYDGAVGVKTGFTNNAGHCLIAAADSPSGTLVSVVLASPDHYGESAALFDHGKALAAGPPVAAGSQPVPDPTPSATLATPPPAPSDQAVAAAAAEAASAGAYQWPAFMAVVGALMLATLHRSKKTHPIREAAQFHAFLEPLARGHRNGSGPRRPRPDRPQSARPRTRARAR